MKIFKKEVSKKTVKIVIGGLAIVSTIIIVTIISNKNKSVKEDINCLEVDKNEQPIDKVTKEEDVIKLQLEILDSMSSVTKKVISNFNAMSDQQFMNKYQTSKSTYCKRVNKYGDPYMNAPLAKLGKVLNILNT